jgi:hypothetical protein
VRYPGAVLHVSSLTVIYVQRGNGNIAHVRDSIDDHFSLQLGRAISVHACRAVLPTWEKQVLSARGSKRVRRHSEDSIYAVWRCYGRGPEGSSEPPEPRICYSPLPTVLEPDTVILKEYILHKRQCNAQ